MRAAIRAWQEELGWWRGLRVFLRHRFGEKFLPFRYIELRWDDDGTGYEKPLWRWRGRDYLEGSWQQSELFTIPPEDRLPAAKDQEPA